MTLIKPPCCNGTTGTPLHNSQLLINLERAEALRLGFELPKAQAAYIIAVQYCEQTAHLVDAVGLNEIMAEYYAAIWSAVHAGVGFDAKYETLLIEVEKQYAEEVICAFDNEKAPKDNQALSTWLAQYRGKVVKCTSHPVDPDDRNETVPSIVVLRPDNNGGAQVRISHSLTAYDFFNCPFKHGNYASSITTHINNLLENKDTRLLQEIQKDLNVSGTFKILCTDVKFRANWSEALLNWQPIDLNKPKFFLKNKLKEFITVTL